MVYELRDDLKEKAEKHELEVILSECEHNKKHSQQLPSREELVSRLENHAKIIEERMDELKS